MKNLKSTLLAVVLVLATGVYAQHTEVRYIDKEIWIIQSYNEIDSEATLTTVTMNNNQIYLSYYNGENKEIDKIFDTNMSGKFIDENNIIYSITCIEVSDYESKKESTIIFEKNKITIIYPDKTTFVATYNCNHI